jgi:hypothetical protein
MATTPAIRVTVFAMALTLLAATTASLRATLDRRENAVERAVEPVYLPRADLLRPLSLGYHNVLADILWFRAISYFGKHYRSDRTYPWLAHICDLVTDLDPRAEHVYQFAGLILPWEAGEVDAGIRILEKGVRAIPDSWGLAYYLGFTHFFFKNDSDVAAAHLQRAVRLPGAHPGVARLATIVTTEASGPETAMAFLRDLEQNLDSEQVRRVIHRNMQESAAAVALRHLDSQIVAYTKATGRAPQTLNEMIDAGFLQEVPRDPMGGHFEIGSDGRARSSTGKTPGRSHVSKTRERALEGKHGADLLGK